MAMVEARIPDLDGPFTLHGTHYLNDTLMPQSGIMLYMAA